MQTMREKLKEQDEYLFRKFEECFENSKVEWLPAVPPKSSSFNSLPHILNVEKKIDELLFSKYYTHHHNFNLSAAEHYILLSAILLHDLGKSTECPDHENVSADLIRDNWAELKIASLPFAHIIADVAQFHDCTLKKKIQCKNNCRSCNKELLIPYGEKYKNGKYKEKKNVKSNRARREIANIEVLENYGEIRSRKLATLLFLGDHLDGGKARTTPGYVEDEKKKNIVREFRNRISDHRVDLSNRMICTIIDTHNEANLRIIQDILHVGSFPEKNILKVFNEKIKNIKNKKDKEIEEQNIKYIGTVIENAYENDHDLKLIINELRQMGLRIDKWLIECNSILYEVRCEGKQYSIHKAYEPTLLKPYLKKVLYTMQELARGIIGQQYHSYFQIINSLKEPHENLSKIKAAVKRLQIISEDMDEYNKAPSPDDDKYYFIDELRIKNKQEEFVRGFEIDWDENNWALFTYVREEES